MNYELKTIIKLRYIVLVFLFFIILNSLFIIQDARAAVFSLEAPVRQIRLGDEFGVSLMLDTEKQEINAVEAKIVFPLDILELRQIGDGNSLINLWVEKPMFITDASGRAGAVSFSGIIPGGYNGYLGKKKIISLFFKAKNNGVSSVFVTEAMALLNDGLGTAAAVTTSNFIFSVSSDAPAVTSQPIKDQERPEIFTIQVSRDANIFDGRWFAVFSTQDKKSGINHYEIAESKTSVGAYYEKLSWHRAESPYLLSDQALASYIYVKAVDNENNEQVAVFFPRHLGRWYKIVFWSIILLILVSLLLRRICRRKKTIRQD